MKTWITAAALVAAVPGGLGAATVQAQTMPSPPPAPMQGSDDDGDGMVTRDEAAADADRRFAAMDANHDGKLTRDERRTWRDERRAPPPGDRGAGRRPRRDADQDRAAFRERALARFDRIDTNHDGRIDANEREAMMLMMRARRVGHDRPHRDGAMPPADPAAPTG